MWKEGEVRTDWPELQCRILRLLTLRLRLGVLSQAETTTEIPASLVNSSCHPLLA